MRVVEEAEANHGDVEEKEKDVEEKEYTADGVETAEAEGHCWFD